MKHIHTITKEDVHNTLDINKRTSKVCPCCNQKINGVDFFRLKHCMGNLLPSDVGKHVYEITSPNGHYIFYQVENDEELQRRKTNAKQSNVRQPNRS